MFYLNLRQTTSPVRPFQPLKVSLHIDWLDGWLSAYSSYSLPSSICLLVCISVRSDVSASACTAWLREPPVFAMYRVSGGCVYLCLSLDVCFSIYAWLSSVRIVQKEVGGRNFSVGGAVERRGGGSKFFSTRGWKRGGGRILLSIIEERGKLHNKSSLWCKKSVQRNSHCLPQQYLG